jgi:hypothetical protein
LSAIAGEAMSPSLPDELGFPSLKVEVKVEEVINIT